ncbi:MAG: hemolysin [Ilumatobacteraceae bacterium]|nr:hemolysin [Ilumatobacteraceae bacterium]MCU1391396.1 hemolysin [Ilumatobacteraceae bacterium]
MRRGLSDSRTQASEAIDAKRVLVNGTLADKSSRQVDPADAIVIEGPPPRFVSRGGEKLDGALTTFAIDVSGLRVLDAGASTGGFTDCLLQRGAREVVALDVGHGQLHPKIRNDPRVLVLERYNVRELDLADIGGEVDAVVADLSFISLRRVIAPLVTACRSGGSLVLLVKPQFEAGRQEVSKGKGVISDPAIHDRVVGEIEDALVGHHCTVVAWTGSSLTGADGNREFLVHARTPRQGSHP